MTSRDGFADEVREEVSAVPREMDCIEQEDPGQATVSTASRRLITLPQRTNKSSRRGRVSAQNIVRTQRGPTRMCRNLNDPILCFNVFFTDEIISEIVKWTNAEINNKRRETMTSATFRDT